MSNTKYKITTTSNGDKIRHRVATIILDGKGSALVDMLGFMYCPEFPGGGVDEGESTIEAALREAMEESGWVAEQPYEMHCPGDWTYRVQEGDRHKNAIWNLEENLVVICKSGEYKPDATFGSEHDALKCKMVPLGEIVDALKKKLSGKMDNRFKIKNELILTVLESLLVAEKNSPKWIAWK